MRLRRLEFAIIAITLAFAIFMAGFFTGRNRSSVNITAIEPAPGAISTQTTDTHTAPQDTQIPQNDVLSNDSTARSNDTVTTPMVGNSLEGTGIPRDGDGRININTATKGELTDLPGIGDVIASRIIEYRVQNGVFAKIEDIRNVSGIGERKFEAIKDLISVG